MAESAPFSMEELGGLVHKLTIDFFATQDEAFNMKLAEEGLSREQVAALVLGDAMRLYTQEHSATAGEAANFILEPDWKYVKLMICDLLTEMYVERTAEYEAEAEKRGLTLHHLAASILITQIKLYLEGGEVYQPRIGIPEKHLHDHAGLEEN